MGVFFASVCIVESGSVLLVTDVSCFCGVKGQVADRCNEGVDAKGNVGQKEICQRSGGISFGFEICVINDDTADPAQEECKQKANQLVVVFFHNRCPFLLNCF